jgi:hypothetical protein
VNDFVDRDSTSIVLQYMIDTPAFDVYLKFQCVLQRINWNADFDLQLRMRIMRSTHSCFYCETEYPVLRLHCIEYLKDKLKSYHKIHFD